MPQRHATVRELVWSYGRNKAAVERSKSELAADEAEFCALLEHHPEGIESGGTVYRLDGLGRLCEAQAPTDCYSLRWPDEVAPGDDKAATVLSEHATAAVTT